MSTNDKQIKSRGNHEWQGKDVATLRDDTYKKVDNKQSSKKKFERSTITVNDKIGKAIESIQAKAAKNKTAKEQVAHVQDAVLVRDEAGIVAEEFTEPEAEAKRYPSLNYKNGVLQTYYCKYKILPQGKKGLEAFLTHLLPGIATGSNGKPIHPNAMDKSRITWSEGQPHPHTVGAVIRALLSEMVYYCYEPKAKIFEPAVSVARLSKLVDTNGDSLSKRVSSSAAVIDIFDLIRKKNHGNNSYQLENHCDCKLTNGNRIYNCKRQDLTKVGPDAYGCKREHEVQLGVECLYYKNVLEGMVHAMGVDSRCYGVFNDYHKSMLTKGLHGKAFDDESEYTINPDATVSVKVNENPFPYHHGIINTGGEDYWQTEVFTFEGKIKVRNLVFFQKMHTFVNGDVPARLVKFIKFTEEELKELGVKDWIPGVYVAKEFFLKKFADDKALRIEQDNTARVNAPYPEFSLMDEDVSRRTVRTVNYSNVVTVETVTEELARLKISMKTPTTVEPFFKEEIERTRIKPGSEQLSFLERSGRTYDKFYDFAVVDLICKQFQESNERFFLDRVKAVTYISLEIDETRWWTVGLKTTRNILRQPLELVTSAFRKLGNKSLASSVDFVITQLQREVDENGSLGEMADLAEAVTIARVIRAQQTCRLKNVLENSTSVATASSK